MGMGATREGVFRNHRILSDGYVRDSVYYSVIREEWPAVRERFERQQASRLPAMSSLRTCVTDQSRDVGDTSG
jgi:hypothetical protein